ncbi:BID domain-containing T4SS effector [Bartonella ancashensis]|uniref:BID domain-containing T4SS effector n=1 Tax=Bartonella ancashensis TaxID=1318743 RepID=UPI001F25E387|nr:BID domain-containing T4SS effector [Bartonella ancashensis]
MVYGNPKTLDEKISLIEECSIDKRSHLSKTISKQIADSPQSISKLAGRKYFFIKDSMRQNAERCTAALSAAVSNYVDIFEHVEGQIIHAHQKDQERKRNCVMMPSKKLQTFLSLPKKQMKKSLSETSELEKELGNYTCALHARLSPNEHTAIKNSDYVKLSESIGTSVKQAKKIATTVKLIRNVQKQVKKPEINPSKEFTMAALF